MLLSSMTLWAGQPQWYKGNTHAHSVWSDGSHLPEQVVDWYKQHGYQFLVLTDHNVVAQDQRWRSISSQIMAAALKRFGSEWLQTRPIAPAGLPKPVSPTTAPAASRIEVRLKTLMELQSKFQAPGNFFLIGGEEFSDSAEGLPLHLCLLNIQQVILPKRPKPDNRKMTAALVGDLKDIQEVARGQSAPMLVQINHPNFGYALTAEDLVEAPAQFMEIANAHPAVNNEGDPNHVSVTRMWDIANSIRIHQHRAPLYGIGSDDAHSAVPPSGAYPGRSWIMVRSMALTAESLFAAMKVGDFYASSGVTLAEARFDPEKRTLSVEVQPDANATYTIQFIGTLESVNLASQPASATASQPAAREPRKGRYTGQYSVEIGRILQESHGTRASYAMTGKELFVRAVVRSDKPSLLNAGPPQQAWTQPVGWAARVQQ
jgi:hypothetical protein